MAAAPDGTKPWRKGWRKRWREGSSFRALSPIAKLACVFSEENADDEGKLVTTVRQMAEALSGWHHEQKVSRMVMWRAWKELENAGLWSIQAGRKAQRMAGRTPSVITRVNFKRYQDSGDAGGTQGGTRCFAEAGHSSRGVQRNAEERSRSSTDHQPFIPSLGGVGGEEGQVITASPTEWRKRQEERIAALALKQGRGG